MITNNHYEARAGANALELKSMLTGKRVKAPPALIDRYPDLRKFADPDHEAADPEFVAAGLKGGSPQRHRGYW